MRLLLTLLAFGGLLCALPGCHHCGECHREKAPKVQKEKCGPRCHAKGCGCRSARMEKEERY